jgi:hypothetical protein
MRTFEPYQEPWLILGDARGASYVLQGKNYVRPDNDRLFLELLVSLYNDIIVFKLTDSDYLVTLVWKKPFLC